ncbi:MAG: hypothetical protein U5P10_12365 [Spirochaetia bacterium]|nr:hypothetical protein [Spirochaetia bacterium]
MKKSLLVAAIVIAMLVPMTVSAIDADWSGSYELQGFMQGETADDIQGFYQSLRIAPTFDLGGDVKVHVGLRLYDQYWSGDHRKPGGGGVTEWDDSSSTENFGLDIGYVEMPFLGGKLSVGRQEANWGHGLTTSGDRRDRIAYQYDLDKVLGGPLSLLALYDLRQDVGIEDVSSNGHLFAAAAVGYNLQSKILWGLLGGYFVGDATATPPFLLDSVAIVGPFMEGPAGPIDLKFAAHTMFPIDNDRDTFGDLNEDGTFGGINTESGGLWNTFNFAAMLRPALDFSKVSDLQPQVLVVEAQGLFVFNGALVEPGFDTFSSMIGNSGRNTVNPTNVFNMGGAGYEDDHQALASARVNYEVSPGLNAIVAGGMYHFFEYKRKALEEVHGFTDSIMREARTGYFADVSVEYAVTEQATLYATYGFLNEDNAGIARQFDWNTFSWNDIESGDPKQQISAGVKVNF